MWQYDTGGSVYDLAAETVFTLNMDILVAGGTRSNGATLWVFDAVTGALLATFDHGAAVRSVRVEMVTPTIPVDFPNAEYHIVISEDRASA